MQGNADLCSLMNEILENVLIWQGIEVCLCSFNRINFFEQFKSLLPKAYKNLSNFVDCLPRNEHPIAYPFSGFIVNVNVLTRSHWDICIVIPISDCEGGELGLVLDLKNGDMVHLLFW